MTGLDAETHELSRMPKKSAWFWVTSVYLPRVFVDWGYNPPNIEKYSENRASARGWDPNPRGWDPNPRDPNPNPNPNPDVLAELIVHYH